MVSKLLDEEDIFKVACKIHSREARTDYLKQVCRDDPPLFDRVVVLLRMHDEEPGFLESPAPGLAAMPDIPPITEKPGTMIGPYKLREQIGEGGMGLVFVAEQEHPVRRKIALKLIKPGMNTREVIARFEAERQALALMDHPNIAHVLDAGTTPSGLPYFVMELVRGVPITEFCDANRLTLRQRLELFVDVCHAVQHAHQKGIIHRDLKASNILITLHDGTPVVKVIDFGVAKAIGQQLTEKTIYTRFTEMIGTPLYMSPEQAEMSGLDIDTRSDIYSLGVLLYELLTGTTPFDTERLRTVAFDEMRRIIREEEPPRPSKRISTLATLECGGLTPLSAGTSVSDSPNNANQQSGYAADKNGVKPPHSKDLKTIAAQRKTEPRKLSQLFRGELDWIVMKAVEKDRKQRYETASAFAADVLRFLHDERVLACPPTVGYRLRKFARRNRGPVLAGTLVLLALVGGIIGTTWQMLVATSARATVVHESKQKEAALAAAQASERDAKDNLFTALLEQARARRFSRQMGQRLQSLAALAEAASIRPDERLRDEAIAAMALPDVRRVPVACSAPAGTTALGFDGQYRVYARADTQGIISLRRTSDDREIQHIASGPILGESLYFSSDDQFLLALGEGKSLGVWRVADGQRVIRDDLRECWANAFSPDGRRLAVGQKERVICFDLATGQEVNRWALPAQVNSLAFHPDSRQLAVGQYRASVVSVYDASNGALLTDLAVGAMQDQFVAWHPDGERLAVTGSDPRIEIWNVAARRKVATLEGHVQRVPTLTFHPDGNLLASHSWDGTLRLWDPATGRPLLQLPLAIGGRPLFSRDGRWLGAARHGEQIELLEVTPSREYRTLVSNAGLDARFYNRGDFSPDGRLLVVGMDPGTRLWDLYSGRELAALPAGTSYACFDWCSGAGFQPAIASADTRQAGSLPHVLTCGSDGLLRWPITSSISRPIQADSITGDEGSQPGKADLQLGDGSGGARLRLGPPQQLSPLRRAWFERGSDGSLGVVTVEGGTNQIVDLETGAVRQKLGTHPNGEVQALSRDGRWAASCGWHSDRVRLWNVDTGEMVHEWVVGTQTAVFFTPDSRTLIISRGDEFSFWDVATLQPTLRLRREVAQFPGHVAFSPDGKLMAVEMAPAVIHLKDVVTGRTVAKLEDPHGDRATWEGFTPDGTQLVVVARFASAIHIWDLRAIRTRLKEMNLDWDWPEFPPQRSPHAPREESVAHSERGTTLRVVEPRLGESRYTEDYEPVTIEVNLGHLAKPVLTREQRAQQAIEQSRRNLEANPESAKDCNELAWALLTAPEMFRNTEDAVPLAESALRLDPENALYRNTLGVAFYRAGRYREAVEILRVNQTAQPDWALAFDLYFLAMSYHQLGDAARARDYYDLAVRWTKAQKNLSAAHVEELTEFRAEAEELLGVKGDER